MATQQRSTPLVPGAAAGAAEFAEGGAPAVVARGYWEQAWRRFRRDRLAIVSGIFIIFLALMAFIGAPLAQHWLGHGPNDLIKGGVSATEFIPVGPWSHVVTSQGGHTLLILGGSDLLGRDEFLRLLYGAQVSLEVAVFATIFGVSLGVVLGTMAGFYGGFVDTIVSRMTEIVMAFPLLLFAIALAATVGDRLDSYTFFGLLRPGIVTLTLVIGFFSWFYPARIVRAQVLSLREKEFVEAARMVGNSNLRIMRSHLLPHLVGTIIVYSTLTVATNIIFEAALSYLGVGLPLPNASWGNMLSEAVQFYFLQPWVMLFPGLAILFTTLAFNLLGDGLRDALDPRSSL
ncbi:MAG TPA: ABC transporter permease [Gaiellales bacterium]|jgi:peptide/nickel transport system permease protein|nr:ABC transporter permease [Gaiellales bacterium]